MQIIRDPKKVQVVIEKNRWAIWTLLKNDGPLPAEEIAKIFDKNVSTIYRHLKQLIKAGFVEESDQQKGPQKYVVKVYSASLVDAFFILSEEVESKIAAEPGETSYLQETVPTILNNLQSLGYTVKDSNTEEKVKELISTILLDLSYSIGTLFKDQTYLHGLEYNHEFEVMRRFLAMFLVQTDPSFNQQITDLRILLTNPHKSNLS
ncbi:MAG: ArsR family transcriptional regulator [Candidatus Hodarchaeales archaeon]